MKLKLTGHSYKYAVEQILLMMYPGELPDYTGTGDSLLAAEVALSYGDVYAVATTCISSGSGVFRGSARIRRSELTGKLATDRLLQRIIKLSFYKAAAAATGQKPVWGALTGIRPTKLFTDMLERGLTEKQAETVFQHEFFVSAERSRLCADTARASLAVKRSLGLKDMALYIGIPFCPTRCAYCSFVSHSVEKSMKLIEPFLDALFVEIESASEAVRGSGAVINSVYIGGGTPTTLSAVQLDALMKKLAASFDLTGVREYTVEAGRPDTISREKLAVMRDNGATRVSVNPQTMSDDVLMAIGRRHTAADVIAAVRDARAVNVGGINMDLIAGLPSDTVGGFRDTLDTVLSLGPENITVHTLALKKGSRVTLEGMGIPGGPEVSDMLDYAAKRLRQAGYVPYYLYRQKFMSGGFENVGWCLPGFTGLYNICMMEELCTVLALGGGGVTKLVTRESGRIERIFNAKYPYEYIGGIEKITAEKANLCKFFNLEEKHGL